MLEEFTKGDTDQMWTAFKKSFDDEIKQTKDARVVCRLVSACCNISCLPLQPSSFLLQILLPLEVC